MELVTVFNPITAKSGAFTAQTLQTGSTMIVINKSYVDVQFNFPSGDQRLVVANDKRAFVFSDASVVGNGIFGWQQVNIDYPQAVLQLENVVYVEVYAPTEKVGETYPNSISRINVPNLLPYDVGHGLVSFLDSTPTTNITRTIFGTGYWSTAIAPMGLGYDHFYLYQNVLLSAMIDMPGQFPGTGKTGNNATPANISAMSYVPGPFSQPGLKPVDTATHVSNTHWALTSLIPWASSTSGLLIEFWYNQDIATGFHFIFGDDHSSSTGTGISIFGNSSNMLEVQMAFVGGVKTLISTTQIPTNTWMYIAVQYTGTTTNTLNLYINDTLNATTVTSGAPVNATHVPWIMGNNGQAISNPGASMAYFGILFSGPCGTTDPRGLPASRYEHALQSINTDYQRPFLTGYSIDVVNGGTAGATPTFLQLSVIFNPGGLMYAQTPAAADNLHIYNIPNDIPSNTSYVMCAGTLGVQGVGHLQDNFPSPVLTYNTSLFELTLSGNVSTLNQILYNFFGYNLLGIA